MRGLEKLFYFTKKQRNGFFVLLFCIIGLQVALYFDEYLYPDTTLDEPAKRAFAEMLYRDSLARWEHAQLPPPFRFNPNKASDSILKVLGLSLKPRTSLLNYLAKGGSFHKKSDLLRIYNMDTNWYEHVQGFIQLPDNYVSSSHKKSFQKTRKHRAFDPNTIGVSEAENVGLYRWQVKRLVSYRENVKPFEAAKQLYEVYGFDSVMVGELLPFVAIDTQLLADPAKAEKELVQVDIATADSADFLSVRGIGPYSAKRIVAYREALGGFVSVEQVSEVYGVTKVRFDNFKEQLILEEKKLRQLDLNKAGFKDLLAHPYLEYEVVRNILNFREKARPFQTVDELRHIELVDERLFSKIAPYLKVKEK